MSEEKQALTYNELFIPVPKSVFEFSARYLALMNRDHKDLRAIEIPLLYHETAKRHRVPRFKRDRNRRARLNPEPNPDHNINGAAEEIDHAENDELEQLNPNDIQIEPDADPPDLDAVIAAGATCILYTALAPRL